MNQQQWAAALLQRLKIPQTPESMRALVGWAKAEGGNWNNSARYNPLNTTQPEPGAGNTGTQGNIKVYKNWDQGLNATVQTLENGRYGNIISALKRGNASAVGQAIERSPWGTGGLAAKVIGSTPSVGATPAPRVSRQPAYSAAPDNRRQIALGLLGLGNLTGSYPGGSDPLTSTLMQAVQKANRGTPQQSYGTPSMVSGTLGGSPIAGEKAHAATHQTEGLPGYPAFDYMAKAGTPVVAPVSGKIVRFSGHDPKIGPTQGPHGPFGWSIYLQGSDGKTYYLTHLGARDVRVGQTVKQGSVIGAVGDYAKYGTPSHVHMGVHG